MVQLRVLDPRGVRPGDHAVLAPRLDTLQGKKVGLVMIHFRWHSWYVTADRLQEIAREQGDPFEGACLDLSHGSDAHLSGSSSSGLSAEEEREELLTFAKSCDGVLVGLGN